MPARKLITTSALVTLLLLSLLLSSPPHWSDLTLALAQGPDTQSISNELVYNEQQTVYLTNLKRAAHGVPPLRWNRQLTEAARWFSWDSVENRPGGYCGHEDTIHVMVGVIRARIVFETIYVITAHGAQGTPVQTPQVDDEVRRNAVNLAVD